MSKKDDWDLELSKYIKQGDSEKCEKAKMWKISIGLQAVDGLKPSKYLIAIAKEHIEANINFNEAKNKIDEYYKVSDNRK